MSSPIDPTAIPELAELKRVLSGLAVHGSFSLAYSGGLDSRFLAYTAKLLGFMPALYHIIGPQIAPDETSQALRDAEAMGFEATLVPASSLSLPELAAAGRERCYACKKHLFEALLEVSKASGTGPLCDGTNHTDLGVYRPGLKALQELGVRSPLAEAGISKARIREIGREIGFPKPDQMARPCLLTRFPYGVSPRQSSLQAIADAEELVAEDAFGAKLRYRLRMPKPGEPVLHVARASLPEGMSEEAAARELDRLCGQIEARWREALPNLSWALVDKLSGFYDRMPEAEAK